ncbi:MAG: hypothetical protein IPL87_02410 [Candidatus Moraniibacteriota bacterium]|nr:MAG: hypothetical protein IPL87_02410 [Candidatus Moranbacteria bacterium]
MSLVELLVSMSILTMVMGGMAIFFTSIWRTQAFTIEVGQTAFLASRGVKGLSDAIRNARMSANGSFPVSVATPTEFTFYSDVDGDDVIERVHLFYDTTSSPKTVKVGVTDPNGATPPVYPAGDASTSIIASSVVNTASQPVFSYYDRDSVPLPENPAPSSVRMVAISLFVNVDPTTAPQSVEISTIVSLRNLWKK